jgi:hypothetical protein
MAGPAYSTGVVNVSHNADWAVLFVYEADGEPMNLTGSTIRMQVRKVEEAATAIIDVFSPDGGIEFLDAIAGQFVINISREKSQRAPPGEYVTDIVQERSDGRRIVLFEGVANITMGITRW